MSFRLHHIHLVCRELEPMIHFFTEDLGASLVARTKFGNADGASLDLQGTAIYLRLPQQGEKMLENTGGSPYGYHHLGLMVEDLDRVYRELTEKGFEFFVLPKDAGEARIAMFKGPENNTIELMQLK